jgi:hypothetical protein
MAGLTLDLSALDKVLDRAERALADSGENLLEEANKTIPIDTGTLQRSGKVTYDKASRTVVISYDTPYAARQHEDTRLRHANGRRAKWLERTFNEQRQSVLQYIAKQAGQAL